MVITSFKLPIDINRGVSYVPWVDFSPSLHAWQDLMHGAVPVAEPLRNSFIAATTSSLAAVVLGGMAGYGLSRFQYRWGPWRNGDIAFWFISQRMLPPGAQRPRLHGDVQLPASARFGGRPGDCLHRVQLPFAIWIMRDFFTSLPRKLEESSLVEGKLAVDLLADRAAALSAGAGRRGILLFIFSWNEYLLPLLAFEKAKTMPVTIAGMATAIGIRWWLMSALAIVSMVPTVLLGLLLERYIVRGLTAGAIK